VVGTPGPGPYTSHAGLSEVIVTRLEHPSKNKFVVLFHPTRVNWMNKHTWSRMDYKR